MAKLLNLTEAVKLVKTSRPTLYKAIEKGIVTPAAQDNGPKFESKTLRQEWRRWKEYGQLQSRHVEGANKGGRPPKSKSIDSDDPVSQELRGSSDAEKLIKAKAMQATLAAQKAHLELQQQKGELVAVADVRRDWAKLAGTLTEALNGLAPRIAPLVLHGKDLHSVHEIIQREVNRMITSVRTQYGVEAVS